MHEMSVSTAKKIVWEYLQLNQELPLVVDVMIVLGSRDDRVAAYAAALTKSIHVEHVLITGGSAHHGDLLMPPSWKEASEAQHFEAVIRECGFKGDILLETQSTNTGENAQLPQDVLKNAGTEPRSLLIVTKPYMERRALRTFEKQWTYGKPKMYVSSQAGSLDEYVNDKQPEELVTHVMVGDLQRIMDYPIRGFMTASVVPDDVVAALTTLRSAGYDKH